MRQWSNPVPLPDYMARIDKLEGQDAREFGQWVKDLAKGFACEKHPSEQPSVQYRRDNQRLRIVCAPCRGAS